MATTSPPGTGCGILSAVALSTIVAGAVTIGLADRNPSLRPEWVFLPLWALLFLPALFLAVRWLRRRAPGSASPGPLSAKPALPRPLKYDDVSWHFDGEFPDDLPIEAGGTHIGLFLAWAMHRGLTGPLQSEEVLQREMTGTEFLMLECDGKLTEQDLSMQGNAFAREYYQSSPEYPNSQYLADYEAVLMAGRPSLYHVEDSWENFDRLKPVLDRRFEEWQARSR